MPSHSRSSYASAPNHTNSIPEIITYRLDDSLVYVKPSLNYNEAITLAIKEYPSELGPISRSRITFTIQATMNGTRRTVRISESAWERTVSRMVRGEVVAIEILPEETTFASEVEVKNLNLKMSQVDLGAPPKYNQATSDDCSSSTSSGFSPTFSSFGEASGSREELTGANGGCRSLPGSPSCSSSFRQFCPSPFKRVQFLSR
ncbi:hypothetical protein VKT23_015269 [Stygiomarasmius scandens]|uniref:Uncharacterized protein n=1 Tax=Marasmiellus scandens TaxID=2682957 RepID=A0ABR1J2E8_9AGAR